MMRVLCKLPYKRNIDEMWLIKINGMKKNTGTNTRL